MERRSMAKRRNLKKQRREDAEEGNKRGESRFVTDG